MGWPHVFTSLPQGNVAASFLDDNFNAAAQIGSLAASALSVQALQAQTYIAFTTSGVAPAYLLTPSPAIISLIAGQRFRVKFNAAGTAGTLSISGLAVTNIKQYNSTGAKVAANPTLNQLADVEYDGVDFVILNPLPIVQINAGLITNSLVANVLLNNTTAYFDGPSIAQGTVGTWFVSGTVTLIDTAGSAYFLAKLWDGTTVIASSEITTISATSQLTLSLSGGITNPAGNIRISVSDITSTSGKMLFNTSNNLKDCTISAYRIA